MKKADCCFILMVDTKVVSTPMVVRDGASVSVDFLEHLGWAARYKLIGIWAD